MGSKAGRLKSGNDTFYPCPYFPVGSIYMSITNINPSTYFGGEWKQIKDVFLLACGNSYSNGSTGGEATHTLTINEMPSHNHSLPWATQSQFGFSYARIISSSLNNVTEQLTNDSMYNAGGNQPHNNMPPYLAVYVWKRIA